jgi:hypothetical protein
MNPEGRAKFDAFTLGPSPRVNASNLEAPLTIIIGEGAVVSFSVEADFFGYCT